MNGEATQDMKIFLSLSYNDIDGNNIEFGGLHFIS